MDIRMMPQIIDADTELSNENPVRRGRAKGTRQKYLEELIRQDPEIIYSEARQKVFTRFKKGIGTRNFYETRRTIRAEKSAKPTASRRGKDQPSLAVWWQQQVIPVLADNGIQSLTWSVGNEAEVLKKTTI